MLENQEFMKQKFQLSPKETEVIVLLCKGLLYKEIGMNMNISINTVKRHVNKIYQKMGVRNKIEAYSLFMDTQNSSPL
jgi:DNA-binding CsgD family transcriptional regulator